MNRHSNNCAVYDPSPSQCDCGYREYLIHKGCNETIERQAKEIAELKEELKASLNDWRSVSNEIIKLKAVAKAAKLDAERYLKALHYVKPYLPVFQQNEINLVM
jgi:hypothetical protein